MKPPKQTRTLVMKNQAFDKFKISPKKKDHISENNNTTFVKMARTLEIKNQAFEKKISEKNNQISEKIIKLR